MELGSVNPPRENAESGELLQRFVFWKLLLNIVARGITNRSEATFSKRHDASANA